MELTEDRNMNENLDDFLSNNRGIIKTRKGLVWAIIGVAGFLSYLGLLTVLSMIPPLQWLTGPLTGLLFFATGLIFLELSTGGYNLPLTAMMIGTLLIYIGTADQLFPAIRESLGDKVTGGIMIAFGILMLILPLIAVKYYQGKYKTSVDATVIHVEHQVSRVRRGHRTMTYRPIYEFTYLGKEYTVTDKIFSSGSHPSTGEERELLIDENNPERFVDIERIKTRNISSFIAPVIVLALGIYLMVAG